MKRKTSVLLQRLYSQLIEEQKRDIEYPSLQAVAQTYGVSILDTPKDGNCQFHAIAQQLQIQTNKQMSADEVRKAIVQFLRQNPVLNVADGVLDLRDRIISETWEQYLDRLEKGEQWGNENTLLVVPFVFDVPVTVLSDSMDHVVSIPLPNENVNEDVPTLLIGHISELHYVGLIPVDSPCIEVNENYAHSDETLCEACGMSGEHDCLEESLTVSMGKPHAIDPLCFDCGIFGKHTCEKPNIFISNKTIFTLPDTVLLLIFALATRFCDKTRDNISLVCKKFNDLINDNTFPQLQYREWAKTVFNWRKCSEDFKKAFLSDRNPGVEKCCEFCGKNFTTYSGLNRGPDGIPRCYQDDDFCSTSCQLNYNEQEDQSQNWLQNRRSSQSHFTIQRHVILCSCLSGSIVFVLFQR